MKHKLQTHFFLTYFITAVIIIVLYSAFFYRYTSAILIERETKALRELNSSFLAQTDTAIKALDTVSANISYSNLIKEQLYELTSISPGTDEFKNLTSLFLSINGTNLNADQINLYDYNGYVFQVGVKTNIRRINMDSLDWLDAVTQNSGRKTISLPYATNSLKTSSTVGTPPVWYISLYRTLKNGAREDIGIIETMKTCSSIFKSIINYEKSSGSTSSIYIYDTDGALVYPYKQTEADSIPDYHSMLEGHTDTDSLSVTGMNGTKELLIYDTSAYTGWTYMIVQKEAEVLMPAKNLLHLIVAVLILITGFCLILSYITSHQLIKPIRELGQIIHRTALSTLDKNQPAKSENSFVELAELYQEFAAMSKNLKQSMDELLDSRAQELKSRSLALQSQINPHFYYNTLSSIIVLAENKQNEEVITICRNLTRIMRYITGTSNTPVPLREEIDYVQKYLYCMKVRYQDNLSYTLDIDDAILEVPVPKLIIQPIVENALKYGTNCKPPWSISIRSVVTGDFWKIEIQDSGGGFSDEAMAQIQKRIQTADEKPGLPELNINGMGLLNVYIRWRLHCRGQMIFTCENTREHHGIVTIGRYTNLEQTKEGI